MLQTFSAGELVRCLHSQDRKGQSSPSRSPREILARIRGYLVSTKGNYRLETSWCPWTRNYLPHAIMSKSFSTSTCQIYPKFLQVNRKLFEEGSEILYQKNQLISLDVNRLHFKKDLEAFGINAIWRYTRVITEQPYCIGMARPRRKLTTSFPGGVSPILDIDLVYAEQVDNGPQYYEKFLIAFEELPRLSRALFLAFSRSRLDPENFPFIQADTFISHDYLRAYYGQRATMSSIQRALYPYFGRRVQHFDDRGNNKDSYCVPFSTKPGETSGTSLS